MSCVDITEATSVSCEPISTRFHSRMSCIRLYITVYGPYVEYAAVAVNSPYDIRRWHSLLLTASTQSPPQRNTSDMADIISSHW